MIHIFGDHHLREQAFGRQGLFHRLRRGRSFDNPRVTVRTRVFESSRLDHVQTRGNVLELFGDGLADPGLGVATRARLVSLGHVDLDTATWQVRGQRPTSRRPSCASALLRARPFTRIHLDGIGRRARLVGQLRKCEA